MAKKAPDAPADVLARTREDALRIAQGKGQQGIRRVLEGAAVDLSRRIRGGDSYESFTQRRMRQTLMQVTEATRRLNDGIRDVVVEGVEDAAGSATENLLRYMRDSERLYRGISQPLPLREAELFDKAVSGARASVLRRLATGEREDRVDSSAPDYNEGEAPAEAAPARMGILQRYGVETVGTFEELLARGMVTKTSWGEMRDMLVEESPFLQGQPSFWAERIMRTECLTGDARVSGAVVRAAYRRWYEGHTVTITTKSGRHFTATPNHPMLTRRGWVLAGQLNQLDELVCYRGQQDAGAPGDQHVDNRHPRLDELFEALAAVGVRERRRGHQDDFHGDGFKGDVDVARPHRPLALGRFAPVGKPLRESLFAEADPAAAPACARCGRLLSVQKQACLCRGPGLLTRIAQAFEHGPIIAEPQVLRDAVRALTRAVAPHNLLGGNVLAQTWRLPTMGVEVQARFAEASNQALAAQRALDRVGARPASKRCLLGAQASDVELDTVLNLRVESFAGYVYNLTTDHGYYAVHGAYSGNTMGGYNRAGWEATRAADDELGDMVKILCATFDDRTGWDSYQVHGQIRLPDQAFEWADGAYQHPPNRPNDREVVVPHRIAWPIPANLVPVGDDLVAAVYARQRKTGGPGPRPLMTTVDLGRFGAG